MKQVSLNLTFFLSFFCFANLVSEPFIDVVIPCAGKDVETIELCVKGIKEYCSPVRRIIIVSDKKYTDSAEWADETKLYPFTKESIACEIFHGDAEAAHTYMKIPGNRTSWFYQQFLKLYAPLVIPNVAEDVLIVDADVIFLNHVDFIDALGYRLYGASGEYNQPYFDFNSKLVPGLKRTLPFSGICHHTLLCRPVMQELFDVISKTHNTDPWRAMCRLLNSKFSAGNQKLYISPSSNPMLYNSPMAENELYPNFAHTHDPLFKVRHLRFVNSNLFDKLSEYKGTYHFAAFHAWMRGPGMSKWNGEVRAPATDYNIVFIHIGAHMPPYVATAIKQARLFNKFCSIYLISSAEALDEFARLTNAGADAICVDYQKLPLTDEHRAFLNKSTLKPFWQEATERYLVLYDFMNRFNIQNVFHLENDVLIYVNLAELLPVFVKKYSIAVPFDSDKRAISSIVYVKNNTCLQQAVASFAAKAAQNLNDMQILPLLKKLDTNIVGQLPIIMPTYLQNYGLESVKKDHAQNPTDYTSNFELFHCIFDAAAIGQYLGGISPQCGGVGPGFINETCLFNPSRLDYVWEKNGNGLLVPYAVFNGKKYLIANLHVHSKKLGSFSSYEGVVTKDMASEEVLPGSSCQNNVVKKKTVRTAGTPKDIDYSQKKMPQKYARFQKRIIYR